MKVKSLHTIPFDILIDCFFKAFENYYVQIPQDKNYLKNRWKAANVQYDLSYGMFDKDQLVGFIIHAIDTRNNQLTSYNSGTGVLPEYRGQKIVKSIYDHALTELTSKGIKKHTLEVITKNKAAIKAYENVGFSVCKNYLCFSGELNLKNNASIRLKEVDYNYFDWKSMENQTHYSWDNHYQSLSKASYTYYLVLLDNTIQSYFVIHPENGYIAQFDLLDENASYNDLFCGIQKIATSIRINNVDEKLTKKVTFLNKIGLKNTINQYEMELIL